MPQINFIKEGPREPTALERTIASFSERDKEIQDQRRDSEEFTKLYKDHLEDGQNIEKTIQAVNKSSLSPTAKVNEVKRLSEFKKYNLELQKKAQQDANVIEGIEDAKQLPRGTLKKFEGNPSAALQATKESKGNQADRPIHPDQLKRIQEVEATQEYQDADVPEKERLLRNNLVSKENIEGISKSLREEAKPDAKRQEVLAAEQAKADIAFAQEQADAQKEIFSQQQTLDEAKILNDKGVTGSNWDIAMQKVGLLQYTSDGYRIFSSLAKDAVKNQNIKATIGSQISQLEFGFFRDATINPNFRKEANDLILRKEGLVLRYRKLYADISEKILEENGGKIPERYQQKVNKEFAKQAEKISDELKQTARDYEAIQNVPPGKVLMFDDKRRPLHVPANEVEKYSKLGASSS